MCGRFLSATYSSRKKHKLFINTDTIKAKGANAETRRHLENSDFLTHYSPSCYLLPNSAQAGFLPNSEKGRLLSRSTNLPASLPKPSDELHRLFIVNSCRHCYDLSAGSIWGVNRPQKPAAPPLLFTEHLWFSAENLCSRRSAWNCLGKWPSWGKGKIIIKLPSGEFHKSRITFQSQTAREIKAESGSCLSPVRGPRKRQPHPWAPVYFLSETCPSPHGALSHQVIKGPRTLHAILYWGKYQIVPRSAENVFPHGDHFKYSAFEFSDFYICNRWCFYSILQFINHFPLQSALTLVTHQWEVNY